MTDAEIWHGPVADGGPERPSLERRVRFTGRVWSVISDDIDFDGHVVTRDVQIHMGAVAIIALDTRDRVLLIRQYRHPVGQYLFEPPAGLIDHPHEAPDETARRELAEEAGIEAGEWHVLLDIFTSPGGSSEAIRIYLARDLRPIQGGRVHTGEAEEGDLPQAWIPLDDAVVLVMTDQVGSPTAVSGILAATVARAGGWAALRPYDAPWPARDHLRKTDRLHVQRP